MIQECIDKKSTGEKNLQTEIHLYTTTEYRDKLKAIAKDRGETVSGFIKTAIAMRLRDEGLSMATN